MATAKKATAPRKKSTSTAKKSPATRKPSTSKTKQVRKSAFMTVQPTVETVYWAVFGIAILALGIWVLTLTMKVNEIYDQIEVNNAMTDSMQVQPAAKVDTK